MTTIEILSDAHAGGNENYRGDEAEPVGDRVGDNRGADEGDDHLDGHEAAGFPSWDECGGRAAVGPKEGRSQPSSGRGLCQIQAARSLQTLPSAPLGIVDSCA